MEQYGIVVKKIDTFVEIASTRLAACGTSCESCGAKCAESKEATIIALNTIGLEVGDRVKVDIDSREVLRYISLMYGLPLIFFFIGLGLGYLLGSFVFKENIELVSLICAIVVTIIAYTVIRRVDKNFGLSKSSNLILTKIG